MAQCDLKFTAILMPQPSSVVIIDVWQYYSQLHLSLKINKINGILYSIGLGHYSHWFTEYHFFRISKPHRENMGPLYVCYAPGIMLYMTEHGPWVGTKHGRTIYFKLQFDSFASETSPECFITEAREKWRTRRLECAMGWIHGWGLFRTKNETDRCRRALWLTPKIYGGNKSCGRSARHLQKCFQR